MDYVVKSKISRCPAFYDKEQKKDYSDWGIWTISEENMYLLKDKEREREQHVQRQRDISDRDVFEIEIY